MPYAGKKIRALRAILDAGYPQTKLEIDGRVSLADIRSYGGGAVDVFVAGSTCLRREDLPGSFEQLFALRGQVISEAKE